MANKITVTINGTDYTLMSEESASYMQKVAALVDAFRARPDALAALGHNGVRGNPCLFPARFFPELRSLTEDQGGSTIIRRHQEELALVEVPACQLEDVDEPQALLALGRGDALV